MQPGLPGSWTVDEQQSSADPVSKWANPLMVESKGKVAYILTFVTAGERLRSAGHDKRQRRWDDEDEDHGRRAEIRHARANAKIRRETHFLNE
ncbi:uncharacterized protein BDZ83DRAFT_640581 [Colletotrichum acutatum]|uniref:Uncharacterized protein n=1 Tax=Glomerella acutata TaxID=27357 RepID=A0AAD8XBS6_GLOAC|nr:uncharacterized protein BDZ83DRAFT_640581 [Colletotrichum acutatum]KAK1710353.1 hypothetical protein BDZ83DRAFT_640581 [Colletotrichum acutatum]